MTYMSARGDLNRFLLHSVCFLLNNPLHLYSGDTY
jgi:hypothetical protein